jgi:hypothetical protein
MSSFQLTAALADSLASLPMRGIQREYPNAPSIVLLGPEDIQPPKELHPAFYGCFDWHSSVHGHWMLVRLLKQFDLTVREEIRNLLRTNLTTENIDREASYLKARPSFERTYGWAWLLKLCEELHGWDDPDGREWARNLKPLENAIRQGYIKFLPKQTYPIRVGTHGNTAFGLSFALDYSRTTGDLEFEGLICNRARDYYELDPPAPVAFEPGGNDFFSPSLIEADLMSRVLEAREFAAWFGRFLPDPSHLFTVAHVSDRSDPQIGHLDGLNLSRAWCLKGIAHSLPKGYPAVAPMVQAAEVHAAAGLEHVQSGHYEGEHWLASFAVYLLTRED